MPPDKLLIDMPCLKDGSYREYIASGFVPFYLSVYGACSVTVQAHCIVVVRVFCFECICIGVQRRCESLDGQHVVNQGLDGED